MAQNDEKLKRTVAGFAVLLTTVTELVRAKAGKPAMLDAYDDASDQIMEGLRNNGMGWNAMGRAYHGLWRKLGERLSDPRDALARSDKVRKCSKVSSFRRTATNTLLLWITKHLGRFASELLPRKTRR